MREKDKTIAKPTQNPLLRYQEKLNLNKKNSSATFRSMTREKRNYIADGRGIVHVNDQPPPVGKYTTRIEVTKP